MNYDELGLALGHALNSSIISDPAHSYIAITALRVVVIGTLLLAARRVHRILGDLPRWERGEGLVIFFGTPWWRVPIAIVNAGLALTAFMLALQAFAGNIHQGFTQLGSLTPYLLFLHIAVLLIGLGVAFGASAYRQARAKIHPAG